MVLASFVFVFFTLCSAARAECPTLSEFFKETLHFTDHQHAQLMQDISEYHRGIHLSVSPYELEQLPELFKDSLSHVKRFAPEFPKDEFLDWYLKHPFSEEELAAFKKKGAKLGELLHEKAMVFEKTIPHLDLTQVRNDLGVFLKDTAAKCGTNEICQKTAIQPWIVRAFRKTCLGNPENKAILDSVVSGVVIYNVSLFAGHFYEKNSNLENFPYEMLLDRIIMYPIFSEIGCRNVVRQSKSEAELGKSLLENEKDFEIGNELQTKTYRTRVKEWTSQYGKSYVSYMKWAPIEEGFYLGLHTVVEKAKGHEVQLDPVQIGKEYLGLLAYDAGFAYLIRNPLVMDPVFLKWLPRYKGVIESRFAGRLALQIGLYRVPEVSLRLLQELQGQKSFKCYEAFLELWLKQGKARDELARDWMKSELTYCKRMALKGNGYLH